MMISKKIVAGFGDVSEPRKQTIHQVLAKWRDVKQIVFSLTLTLLLCPLIYHSASRLGTTQSLQQLSIVSAIESPRITAKQEFNNTYTIEGEDRRKLTRVLKEASMEEKKTVIVTMMNKAYAEPNSMFDVYLEAFRVGQGTKRLLRHVVVVCLDEKAYSRCNEVHPRRCFLLRTTGVDFSGEKRYMMPDYLKMMWLRTEFLGSLLRLGYNFLFTDIDTMWLRDPFPQLLAEVDFQVAGDHHFFNGNSSDVRNKAHGGFSFVMANRRTVEFYNYWYASRLRFSGKNELFVLERIKNDCHTKEIGLKMRFLDPVYFGNFCQPNWDISKVCLMHGTCCAGKENKVNDLRQVLEDWKNYTSVVASDGWKVGFRPPMNCWIKGRPQ